MGGIVEKGAEYRMKGASRTCFRVRNLGQPTMLCSKSKELPAFPPGRRLERLDNGQINYETLAVQAHIAACLHVAGSGRNHRVFNHVYRGQSSLSV